MLLFLAMDDFASADSGKSCDKEDRLIRRIGEGEAEAFCELYRMHAKTVYAYGLSILRNHHDAEEVMQDTFLKIRAAAHLYEPLGKPLARVLQITKNLCLMRVRKNSRMSGAEFEEIENDSRLSACMDVEDRIVLQAAFCILTEEERSIILLHAVTGLKHREIAETIQKPISTVLSRYNRGLKKLRNYLEGTEYERK